MEEVELEEAWPEGVWPMKKEAGRAEPEEGEGRSKEDWAVVAEEVEADVSEKRRKTNHEDYIFGPNFVLFYSFRS